MRRMNGDEVDVAVEGRCDESRQGSRGGIVICMGICMSSHSLLNGF